MENTLKDKANFCPYCGAKLHENCQCWVKKHEYNCGYDKCPRYNLFGLEKEESKFYCINEKELKKCKENFALDDFKGKNCIIGVASPSKLEMASAVLEFKVDGHYYAFNLSFMAEKVYELKMRHSIDFIDFGTGVRIISKRIEIYKGIEESIKSIEEKYGLSICEIVYDPYDSFKLANILERGGYTTVECRQGPHTLNKPARDLIENIHNSTLHHNGDNIFNFSIRNMAIKETAEGLIMPDRAKSASNISPALALINAHSRAMYVL